MTPAPARGGSDMSEDDKLTIAGFAMILGTVTAWLLA